MNLGMRLTKIREQKKLTQKDAAKLLGISNVVLNRYEKNERNPNPEMLNRLSQFYGVSTDWLLCRTDEPLPPGKSCFSNTLVVNEMIRVPVYAEICASEPMLAKENIINYYFIPSGNFQCGEYFYLEVKDNSMQEARLQTGDYVLVRKQKTLENGQVGVFVVDKEFTIKRFYKHGDLAILKPDNIVYQPKVINLKEIVIVGLVVEAKIMVT